MSRPGKLLSVAIFGMAMISQVGCNSGYLKPGMGTEGCWVELRAEPSFRGRLARIEGPTEYMDMNWVPKVDPEELGSLETGPQAWVEIYSEEDFSGGMLRIGPDTEIADLVAVRFGHEDLQSMRIYDAKPQNWEQESKGSKP